MKIKKIILSISMITIMTCVTGCSAWNESMKRVQKQNAEIKARGTIKTGEITWAILSSSKGGNRIRTYDAINPGRQKATDASDRLCKKYGRVAQYVSKDEPSIVAKATFTFNCVR